MQKFTETDIQSGVLVIKLWIIERNLRVAKIYKICASENIKVEYFL